MTWASSFPMLAVLQEMALPLLGSLYCQMEELRTVHMETVCCQSCPLFWDGSSFAATCTGTVEHTDIQHGQLLVLCILLEYLL